MRALDAKLTNKLLFRWLSIVLALQIPANASLHQNETDKLALLAFKQGITQDPLEVMTSWNQSIHFCDWTGVLCSRRHEGRVISLDLNGRGLGGSLAPSIGNLSFLRRLDLGDNNFKGHLPQEVGRLFRLRLFNLSVNSFQGEIPSNLSFCSSLRTIDLDVNKLTGKIPDELSNLGAKKLKALYVTNNNLTGNIPRWLGNFSSLIQLSMARNNFWGSIPVEIGQLSKLIVLVLSQNTLTGMIPPSIYNLSSLRFFYAAVNQLHGKIPQDIGFTLPNLLELGLAINSLHGWIPTSFPNASQLELISLAVNNLTGTVPLNLGNLRGLERLELNWNRLETGEEGLGFLTSLTNCSGLKVLNLVINRFKGELPNSISNFSTKLDMLGLGGNEISGHIPEGIGNLVGLTRLYFSSNYISGGIPSSIGRLERLILLDSGDNRISGSIPTSLGNLTQLLIVDLNRNNLEGKIPPGLGKLVQLNQLLLDQNNLSGNLPKQLLSSSTAVSFNLSRNSLTGPIPEEVGNMGKVVDFDISHNKLVGRIPATLNGCLMLEHLLLQHNLLGGSIPSSLTSLKSLRELDLSNNNLSGQIPSGFQNFTLMQRMNLSFNKLEGEVPNGGVFRNMSVVSMVGNKGLCGGTKELRLPPCKNQGSEKHHGKPPYLKVVIPVTVSCIILLLVFLVIFPKLRKPRRKSSTTVQSHDPFPKISHQELSRATNDFSSSNLIGEGSFGSVYKGIIGGDGMVVAVKVLNLTLIGAGKSFLAECEALRSIRHRNITKIITVCSSIDFKGNDFKALVYEFMQNGSLDGWLHPTEVSGHTEKLSFIQILNLSIDVAAAIEYLHYHCEPQIVHGDLKPSNVFFDHDMVAHVSDFGLARFLPKVLPSGPSQTLSSSSAIKGTIGYIAPEYGMGTKASMRGDVYSFGILLLEIITGKRPTDRIFEDGLTLHQYMEVTIPDRIMDVIEPSLLQEILASESHIEVRRTNRKKVGILESLVAVAKMGAVCSMESANDRPEMKYVVAELCAIREKFLGKRI